LRWHPRLVSFALGFFVARWAVVWAITGFWFLIWVPGVFLGDKTDGEPFRPEAYLMIFGALSAYCGGLAGIGAVSADHAEIVVPLPVVNDGCPCSRTTSE